MGKQANVVASIEGKSIQAKEDEQAVFTLLIDGNVHGTQKASVSTKGNVPLIKVSDFPFSSGAKTIEVFVKPGLFGEKCKICINGSQIAGDSF
jgi:hypothetical protein